MTINDMLWDSITLQGTLVVTRYDERTEKDETLYNGLADYVGNEDGDWLDEDINFIYPNAHYGDELHIELVPYQVKVC